MAAEKVRSKHDDALMTNVLQNLQGTYFLVADIRPLAGRGSRAENGRNSSSAQENGDSGDRNSGNGGETDVDFCQRLTVEAGVTLIPVSAWRQVLMVLLTPSQHSSPTLCTCLVESFTTPTLHADRPAVVSLQVSAFYSSPDPPRHLVRFCFCKSMDKLRGAADRLQAYFAS